MGAEAGLVALQVKIIGLYFLNHYWGLDAIKGYRIGAVF